MKKPSKIAHPLKNRKGTSQATRVLAALQPDAAPIDGKTMADQLYLISEYARYINFYEYVNSSQEGEYQLLDSWASFFTDSLPFQLARLGKTDIDDLEEQFLVLYNEHLANPSQHSLESLLGFLYNRLILPAHTLYGTIAQAQNSFGVPLLAILQSSFKEPLTCFIALYNASATFLCIEKRNFTGYIQPPWQLQVGQVYDLDLCIKKVKKGKKEAYLLAAQKAHTYFLQMLNGLREITEAAPDYIQESLVPLEISLQKQHQPHLALLFTFLQLFKHLQGNLNKLGKTHLDFFYKEVLKMIPKEAVADRAHLVFEIAKHLDAYPLPKDLLLKDGKDNNKQDILFGLDHELILDKARVKELRTLTLNTVNGDNTFVEGVYMAPVANSLDGKGKKFEAGQPVNWASLGSRYSKFIAEGELKAEEHPKARLGFVLSSPVLLLQEGKRKVTILLDCDIPNYDGELTAAEIADLLNDINTKLAVGSTKTTYCINDQLVDECTLSIAAKTYIANLLIKQNPYVIDENELEVFLDVEDAISCLPVFTEEDKRHLKTCLNSSALTKKVTDLSMFNLWFSGEKEWIKAVPKVQIHKPPIKGLTPSGQIQFELTVTLQPDDPAVVFYNEENLKEKFDLEDRFPLVKIELNEAVKVDCGQISGGEELCCLKRSFDNEDLIISPYHFLKELQLVNSEINVEVCGVRNLIVQNDENLQDVNKPIMPFGPRPKVNSSFVIGSREIFCKNWQSCRVNVKWKDLPADLGNYYEAYNQNPPPIISNNSFDVRASILEEGNWEINGTKKLFLPTEDFLDCPKTINTEFDNGYKWDRLTFGNSTALYKPKSMPEEILAPLNVNSRKAFLRLQLQGEDFQHDRYAFVLAQQMFKLARVADLIKSAAFINEVNKGCDLATINEDRMDDLAAEIASQGGVGGTINDNIVDWILGRVLPLPTIRGLEDISDELKSKICALKALIDTITGGVNVVLPNEPYTPIIKSLSIDYSAIAHKDDMEIVHLYPFENTSKSEDILQGPTLFPYFNDEGTLFIGLEEVTPGGSLSLLFQLAEATADSEANRALIQWHYLSNNEWILLRPEFDVISDETDGLTVSGIVTIALPDSISKIGNTLMPDSLYWIKVSAPENVRALAETISIHAQAARASARLGKANDTHRLEKALDAGSIAKLAEGDFNVKKVEQLYPSFNGRKPEAAGHFYTRVSEHLKHKGRALMASDYEKLVLEGFPEIYKVKCISHSMGLSANTYRRDLEVAPGFVLVTVIPDLTKLNPGNVLKPKAPVSLLEKIGEYLRNKTSPFARLKVMNPRYEFVDVEVKVRLYRGKPESFYSQKLKDDITLFLAPWFLGDTDKLAFGQEVPFSDLVGYIEQLDYVDFITDLKLSGACAQNGTRIQPLTARSILTAGEICVITDKEECKKPVGKKEFQN